MEPLLQRMAAGLAPSSDASAVSAVQLSRVLHLVGCTATQQLVGSEHSERCSCCNNLVLAWS